MKYICAKCNRELVDREWYIELKIKGLPFIICMICQEDLTEEDEEAIYKKFESKGKITGWA